MISLEIDRLALATFGFEIFASAIFSLGRIFLRVVDKDDIENNGDFYTPKTFEIFRFWTHHSTILVGQIFFESFLKFFKM